MSAASILPQAPETAIVSRFTLEQECKSIGVDFLTAAPIVNNACLRLYHAYQAWLRWEPDLSGTIAGFGRYLDSIESGISSTTLWRKLKAGYALHRGADPTWEFEALVDAGQMFEGGSELAEVAQAVATNQVARKAEAARNKGTVRVPLTEFGVRVRREIIEALRAGGVQVPEPELDTLAWQFCAENARSFASFVEREAAE